MAQRDEQARRRLTESIRPAHILAMLFGGPWRVPPVDPGPKPPNGESRGRSFAEVLSYVPLERILQAIAAQPSLIREMKLLLAGRADEWLVRFQEDLEAVLGRDGTGLAPSE